MPTKFLQNNLQPQMSQCKNKLATHFANNNRCDNSNNVNAIHSECVGFVLFSCVLKNYLLTPIPHIQTLPTRITPYFVANLNIRKYEQDRAKRRKKKHLTQSSWFQNIFFYTNGVCECFRNVIEKFTNLCKYIL